MTYLLDAHVIAWAIYAPQLLSARVRAILQDGSNTLLLSDSAFGELLNKVGRGKLNHTTDSVVTVVAKINAFGVTFISIEHDQVIAAAFLPQYHHDPFDRMLVAQAMAFSVPLISIDPAMRKYDVRRREEDLMYPQRKPK